MSLVTGKIMSILRASRLLVTMLAACAIAVPANAAVSNADYVKIETGGSGKTSRSVVLGLNKAAIVELPVAARDVLVSDPKVVDAVVRSATRTYLIGLTVGQTNAFFFNDKG